MKHRDFRSPVGARHTRAGGAEEEDMRAASAVLSGLIGLLTVAACARGGDGRTAVATPTETASVRDAGRGGDGEADGSVRRLPVAPIARRDELTLEQVCRMSVGDAAAARPGVRPFTREDGHCAGNFCDTVDDPPRGADACFVATSNIARAERQSAGARRGAPAESRAWDKATPPRFYDRVDAHLHLDDREGALLRKNGFVVLDRLGYESYAVAFHDVFQQQLPVYVGVDAIFNAVFQASQTVLGQIERTRLGPKLVGIVDRMRATLAASRGSYDAVTAADLDLYLVVAHRLLHPVKEAHARSAEVEEVVATIVDQAKQGGDLTSVELFGRERMIDFSQYVPRGHYANAGYEDGFDVKLPRTKDGPDTERIMPRDYFVAMTWLSRLELNLVSRSCRSSQPGAVVDASETPREARDALALADLATRSGVMPDLRAFEDVYSVFAGGREDVPLSAIASLASKNAIGVRDAEAPVKLRAAIGDGFKRTARTHFMPEGATELPAIATMFGSRIVPDIAPLTRLAHPAIQERYQLGAADVAYVMGHDRAKHYLGADLAKYPGLGAALDASRSELAAGARGKHDVYSAWMSAGLRLADPPSGRVPSFMATDAWSDMRMSSALAVYAQIRHTFVLLAGQGYDGYGCEIPDGWVEPAVASYDGMLAWVKAARTAAPKEAAYFGRVEQVLGMLRSISVTELSGAPLSEPQRRWLGMVSEYTPKDGYGDSGEPPKYTGWYFDLFPDREIGAERRVDLVADWFTLTNVDEVRHLGVEKAALGVFVVDVGGEPRMMVGPVAKTYEVATPIAERLDDERAREAPGKQGAWRSFLAPKKPEPSLSAHLFVCANDARVVMRSELPMSASVTLLDHHGDPLGDARSAKTSGEEGEPTVFAFALPQEVLKSPRGIEGMHLHVDAPERWDFVSGVSVYDRSSSPFEVATGAFATSSSSR